MNCRLNTLAQTQYSEGAGIYEMIRPTPSRLSYNERVTAEQFPYRPSEIGKLFSVEIEPNKAKEMKAEMRIAGLPT